MSHSPGPWQLVNTGEAPFYVETSAGFDVASCAYVADARLIAAAPQLLAALKEIRAKTFFVGLQSGNASCTISPEALAIFDALVAHIEGDS